MILISTHSPLQIVLISAVLVVLLFLVFGIPFLPDRIRLRYNFISSVLSIPFLIWVSYININAHGIGTWFIIGLVIAMIIVCVRIYINYKKLMQYKATQNNSSIQ